MIKILPGQLWLDRKGIWNTNYKGEMFYITCSKEPNDDSWKCLCFQEGEMGAYEREFNEMELNELEFIGSLKYLRERMYRINKIKRPAVMRDGPVC